MSKSISWLKFKKYLSAHCTKNIPLGITENIDASISNLSENIRQAVEHATRIQPQIGGRVYSVDVERLVPGKRRARTE